MMMLPRAHKVLYEDLFKIVKSPERYTFETLMDQLSGAFNPKVLKISRFDTNISPRAPSKPALPPKTSKKEYTLILDLDETLVHCEDEETDDSRLNIRPDCHEFLKKVSQFYEVIIFTASLQEYADWAIDKIDPEGRFISHRLYHHN